MVDSASTPSGESGSGLKLRKLSLQQVQRIDDMLASIGEYGEVQLVIQHGELRYINRVESHRAWDDNGSARERDI